MFDINTPPLSKPEIEVKINEFQNSQTRIKRRVAILTAATLSAGIIAICLLWPRIIHMDKSVYLLALVVVGIFFSAGILVESSVTNKIGIIAGVSVFFTTFFADIVGNNEYTGSDTIAVAIATTGILFSLILGFVVSVKIEHILTDCRHGISKLSTIAESDCPTILEIAQGRSEIKAYIKQISGLDRLPTQGEFQMLTEFDSKYRENIEKQHEKEVARKACEFVCTGEI